MGIFRFLWLAPALLLGLGLAPPARAAVDDGRLVLRGDGSLEHAIPLHGAWTYVDGRWVQPDEFASILRTGHATVPAALPGTSALQERYGTYALNLLVDAAPTQPAALHFQRLCGAATLYLLRDGDTAGQMLARFGKLGEPKPGDMLFHQIVPLPPLAAGAYHLLIQQSSRNASGSVLCGPVELGRRDRLEYARALGTIKNVTVVALLLCVALGSLLLGSQNGDPAAPWLALVCFDCALFLVTSSGLLAMLLPPALPLSSYRLLLTGSFVALGWLPALLLMLFHRTLHIGLPGWVKAVNLALAASLTVVFALYAPRLTPWPLPLVALWALHLAAAMAVLVAAARQRRDYAYLSAASCLPLLVALPLDYIGFFQRGSLELMTPYAVAFLVAMHAGIYAMRFGTAFRLAARLSAHLKEEVEIRTRELSAKNAKLEQAQIDLQQANERLQLLSITDGLTGVHNRMHFEQQLAQEWRRCSRQALSLSLLMIDADHFKQLNDSAGHQVGDACLRALAAEIARHFKRAGELVARYGGEEFIVLLPDCTSNKALAAAEGLRIAIERLPFRHGDDEYRVTVSIGVSTVVPGIDQNPAQLIASADAALYEAKDAGRNRIHSIPLLGARSIPGQQQLRL